MDTIKKEYILKWIDNAIKEVKNVNLEANSSYGLKHKCEDSIGIYVSNNEIIECMNVRGFKSKKYGINYHYNISKVINRVVFNNKLGNTYDDKSRCFNKRSLTVIV